MKTILATRYIELNKLTTVEVNARTVKVTGPRGELTRVFRHKNIEITRVGDNKLRVDIWHGKKKDIACLRTICSHIENMMTGVTQGYKYKMRAVYAHFPINLVITNQGTVEIRNFLGERRVRVIRPMEGVSVVKSTDTKDALEISGTAIEDVGRTCSLIRQQAMVRKKDIRKFLDGIYIESRGHISEPPAEEEA